MNDERDELMRRFLRLVMRLGSSGSQRIVKRDTNEMPIATPRFLFSGKHSANI